MRRSFPLTVTVIGVCALALGGCSKPEVKTGSLTQRFTMMDHEGRNFGLVELDPIGGGTVYDATGRVVGQIMPPAPTAVAMAVPVVQ